VQINVPKSQMAAVTALLNQKSNKVVAGQNVGEPIIIQNAAPIAGALHGPGYNDHKWHNIWQGYSGGRHNVSLGSGSWQSANS